MTEIPIIEFKRKMPTRKRNSNNIDRLGKEDNRAHNNNDGWRHREDVERNKQELDSEELKTIKIGI